MNKLSVNALLIANLFFCSVFSQNKENQILTAEKLKKLYPEEKVVCLSSKVVYDFSILKRQSIDETVTTTENCHEEIISLKDKSEFFNTTFYDNSSKIKSISAYTNKTKDKNFLYNDFLYGGENIHYSDLTQRIYRVFYKSMGDIESIKIKKYYYSIKYFTSVYFHNSYPIQERLLEFHIPAWLELELLEKNFDGWEIKKEQFTNEDGIKVVRYTLNNINPYKNELSSIGRSYVLPHIIILPKSITYKKKKTSLIASIDDLYKWYRKLVNQIGNSDETINPLVQKITKDSAEEQDKIKAIFYWVQDNIRYIAIEDGIAGFKPEKAQAVYANLYGDCKGMANLCCEMLKVAGFDARLAWLGTDYLNYDYSIPSIIVDNHMICVLDFNGKRYFLDPTEKYMEFGKYAERIQNRQVLIENGDSYIIDTVPEENISTNLKSTVKEITFDGQYLKGKAKIIYNGEPKRAILNEFSTTKQNEKSELALFLMNYDEKNINVINQNISGLDNRELPIELDFEFELFNQAKSFEDEIYINIDMEKDFEYYDFSEKRKNGYKIPYRVNNETQVILNIPLNFKIAHVPKNIEIKTENYEFFIKYILEENKVVYLKTIKIINPFIYKKDFEKWNTMILEIKKIYDDQIILKKTS
ncbi:MAG TPA: hypothetical protein DEA97_18165 [Bacteroidales bacterium]|nr:MAG: hypothetical protein UR43_C0009G0010 [candidate division TM6 bacterium GW2011_GWF2_33_332]OFY79208.1 MAG: hypothetical protein A2281_14690 [Bacteroidetes bacterium RIFOXYA12_FULL_38_20]HBS88490.1 hypothetical protein [Bacteroidales bacterium]